MRSAYPNEIIIYEDLLYVKIKTIMYKFYNTCKMINNDEFLGERIFLIISILEKCTIDFRRKGVALKIFQKRFFSYDEKVVQYNVLENTIHT